jgi:glutamate dehydrogenase (NAD(P)+)
MLPKFLKTLNTFSI